jgi:hypothetical protein
MRPILLIVPTAILAAAVHYESPRSRAADTAPIDRVAWLTGCWAREKGSAIIEEHWMPPRGGAMLATGRTTRNGQLVEYEFILLREQDGQLAYEAHPSGQAPTTFRSSAPTDTMVVFSDPGHDFPQHVGYRRAGPDSLVAWIEGTIDGAMRRSDFPYHRTSCGQG